MIASIGTEDMVAYHSAWLGTVVYDSKVVCKRLEYIKVVYSTIQWRVVVYISI